MDIEALERKEIRKKQITVGALFAVAILLAMVFAYWMGALGFGPSRSFYLTYNFAGGIDQGSTVRLAGIKVGRVSKIDFVKGEASDGGAPATLRFKIEVSREAFAQITQDSKFFINLAGLIGERYIEIVPGTGAPIASKETLRGVDPPRVDQLLSQGYGIFGDLREFWSENKGDLKEIFSTLNDLSKNLNKLLGGMTGEQKKQFNTLLTNFAGMSTDLKSFVASLNDLSLFLKRVGAQKSFEDVQQLLRKANKIQLNDIRRLMLQDGVKVNFSSKKIPADALSQEGSR
jgi:phospholipid/cholesterol/gamma-HCH transport system substrate-binding protein